jgi:hypothetical protein
MKSSADTIATTEGRRWLTSCRSKADRLLTQGNTTARRAERTDLLCFNRVGCTIVYAAQRSFRTVDQGKFDLSTSYSSCITDLAQGFTVRKAK